MKPMRTMSPSTADKLAIEAFTHIAASEVLTAKFLQATGLKQETVRSAARSPTFLRGLLDYVLAEENLLGEVTEALRVTPETLHQASRSLSKPPAAAPEPEPERRPSNGGSSKPRGDKVDPYPTLPRRSLFGCTGSATR